jgi:hypothetical protein
LYHEILFVLLKTRLEAQSLLNQIAQSRSLKEHEIDSSGNKINDKTFFINDDDDDDDVDDDDADSVADIVINDAELKKVQMELFKKSLLKLNNKTLPTISIQCEIIQNTETAPSTSSGIVTTSVAMDSDTEIEEAGNSDFQIKRFPPRNDNQ